MAEKLTQDQKRWRAESDVDAMARVEEMNSDPARKAAALKLAKERAADLTARARTMSRITGGNSVATKKSAKPAPKTKKK